MIKNKKYKNLSFLFIFFLIFFTIIKIIFFYNFEPRTDQAQQIGWVFKIINSNHFLGRNIFNDYNGVLFEIIKPTYFSGNLHANFFHLSSVFLISVVSKLLFIAPLYAFNIISIISTFFSFFLIKKIIEILFYKQLSKNYFLFFFIFFSLGFCNWYSVIYSPLGVHNLSSMIILINFYLYIKYFNKNFFYFGLCFTFSSLFHQFNFIILSLFYLLIIFESEKKYTDKFKNLLFFSISPLVIIIIPLFIISILNLENYNFTIVNIEHYSFKFFLTKLFFLINKNFTYFFLLFILSCINLFFKNNSNFEKKIKIVLIFLILLSILFDEIFFKSYHRTSIYFFYMYLILFFITFFKILKIKKIKYYLFFLIFVNMFYNFFMINKNYKNDNNDYEFYAYYNNQGDISKAFKEVNANIDLNNIIFLNNLSENYFDIYNPGIGSKVLQKPIFNYLSKEDNNFVDQLKIDKLIMFSLEREEFYDIALKKFNEKVGSLCRITENLYSKDLYNIDDKIIYTLKIDKVSC